MIRQLGAAWCILPTVTCTLACTLAADVQLVRLTPDNWSELAPHGKEVDWIYGDILLRNEQVVAVVAATTPGRKANMTVRQIGGCLIDLTRREDPSDQLSAYYPGARSFEFGKPLLTTGGEDWQPLVQQVAAPHVAKQIGLRFTGVPVEDAEEFKACELVVTYWLRSDADAVQIESEYKNVSNKETEIRLLDSMRVDRDFDLELNAPLNLFAANEYWWGQAYGVLPEALRIDCSAESLEKKRPLLSFVKGTQSKFVLKPAATLRLNRKILPARSQLDLLGRVAEARGDQTYPVTVRVTDPDGPVKGAKVTISRRSADQVLGVVRTDHRGEATFAMAAGEYSCEASAMGRGRQQRALTVGAQLSPVELQLKKPGEAAVTVTDKAGEPIACKVEFRASGSANEDPFFGPDTFAFEVHNLIYAEDGRFRRTLDAGDYDLIISHGPEYDAVFKKIKITQGELTEVNATLVRNVDSTGWVSADFHGHASPSGDNTSSQLGRVLNLLAEHIEFAPCTEHNRVSSYEPHLERLRAIDRMKSCTGIELTGRDLPINHQNAFPLVHYPHTQDGGGPQTADDPVVQIRRLAEWDADSDKLVQENHPNIRRIVGDRDDDGVADGGFRGMFPFMDVIEVHPPHLIMSPPEESNPDNLFGNQILRWLQLLNLGYRIPGVVNTDAHYTFHGSGFLRNFVASSTDDPAQIDVMEMVHSAEQGHVIMSNGPFLKVELFAAGQQEAQIPGDEVLVRDGKSELRISVQCANWFDVNRVQVLLNGRPDESFNFTRRTHPELFSTRTERFLHSVQLNVAEDTHVIVATLGEGLGLGPVVGPDHAEDIPVAVTNPIFLDVDANGFQANQDLLGYPLPRQQE